MMQALWNGDLFSLSRLANTRAASPTLGKATAIQQKFSQSVTPRKISVFQSIIATEHHVSAALCCKKILRMKRRFAKREKRQASNKPQTRHEAADIASEIFPPALSQRLNPSPRASPRGDDAISPAPQKTGHGLV
jgi:hypothetical protein